MTRLTREQSQAVTRQKLLDSARELFAKGGYGGTSIDAICEHAGYSKGAFYPHFPSKEAIFLDILEQHGTSSISALLASLDGSTSIEDAIEQMARWADERSRDRHWSLLLLEYVRHARQDDAFGREQGKKLKAGCSQLGQRLSAILGSAPKDSELLDAVIFELAFAPAMMITPKPSTGTLVRFALKSLLQSS